MALSYSNLAKNISNVVKGRMLEAVTGAGSGTWHRIGGVYPGSIIVAGTATTKTWRVLVADTVGQPTSDSEAAQMGPDSYGQQGAPGGNGYIPIESPVEWIKIVPVTVTGGNMFADIFCKN